ncbi:zinc finger protein 567-like isoform X2 [Drosophila innubila]|uniref:zinc finger protein 567-like isoform X2 n=1 Tax=Drosophila innubila TaxID=198719 RepID=UPI00148D92BE|nr:zinc finger protein 567-like isoform X2 [Drosophila innubila]
MNNYREVAHCYICNYAFADAKAYQHHIFEKECNGSDIEQSTLASILTMVLGSKLQEMQLHSLVVCSICKMSLLDYEALERKLMKLRLEITEMHKETSKAYEAKGNNEDDDKQLESEVYSEFVKEECSADVYADLDEQSNQDEEDTDNSTTSFVNNQYSMHTDDGLMEQCSENDDEYKYLIEECSIDFADLDAQTQDMEATDPSYLDLIERCSENSDLVVHRSDEEDTDLMYNVLDEFTKTGTDGPQKKTRGSKKAQRRLRSQTEFTCSHCGKDFDRRIRLVEHERIHTGERPFKCEVCGASFAQRANWQSHMKTTHLKVANFKCDFCARDFKQRRLLNNHIKSVHNNLRDLSCDHCEAKFSNPVNLKKHQLCHTGDKNYSCEICGKKFSRPENRNVHHFVHSIRKPYACNVCGEGFMRKQKLIHHSKVTKR